jgi:dTDP-glucose 4,6-dehydratase
MAEHLCILYGRQFGLQVKIARCFAFIGPYLPLNAHFAAGNFIRDGLKGGPIVVKGDGTPVRSYLYAADLAIWLWTVLVKGESGHAYNVGSEYEIRIEFLAQSVANLFGVPLIVKGFRDARAGSSVERYIPSTLKVHDALNLKQTFDLQTSILKTIAWNRQRFCEK